MIRSKSARKEAIDRLHKAWDNASQVERNVWILELKKKSIAILKKTCEIFQQNETDGIQNEK